MSDDYRPAVANSYLEGPEVRRLDVQTFGRCRLERVVDLSAPAVATAEVAGGPIALRRAVVGEARAGEVLPLALYWEAAEPVGESYTVFTQLFDAGGRLVAQQDNPPAGGRRPTDTWSPGELVRDPYALALPADAPAGRYTLWVGLYNAAGHRPLRLADGSPADHVELPVEVTAR